MRKKLLVVIAVVSLAVSLFSTDAVAVPPIYSFDVNLVNGTPIFDAATTALANDGKDWYQWIYKVAVITPDNDHVGAQFGFSHFTLELVDCYDQDLLKFIRDETAGANSGSLLGALAVGDKTRVYNVVIGQDPPTGLSGIKFEASGNESLDAIGEYDYFWFSAPTNQSVESIAGIKRGNASNNLFLDVPVPDCPDCHQASVTPEPATMLLFASGLAGAFIRRRFS